jgi:hypothetical protein
MEYEIYVDFIAKKSELNDQQKSQANARLNNRTGFLDCR